MKKTWWLLSVVVAGAVLSWLAHKNISERRAETQQKEAAQASIDRQNEVRSRIFQFAGKYSAVTNWPQRLDGISVFTVDVEEAMMDLTNRAVLFLGTVDDMVRRDGKNYIRFRNWVTAINDNSVTATPDILWVLESADDQFSAIRRQTKETVPVYAVVARIASVKTASPKTEAASTEDEDTDASADSPRTFVARGQCIDVLTLGDDVLDLSWP